MRGTAVTLDPYTLEVSILTGGKVHICSYQDAIDNPELSALLSPEMLECIALRLEHAKQSSA